MITNLLDQCSEYQADDMTMIAILFLPITNALLVIILTKNYSIKELLNALVKSHIVTFLFIALSTELLSAFNLIDFQHLLGLWVFLCLGVLCLAFTKSRVDMKVRLKSSHWMSQESIFMIGVILFILGSTLAAAILYPPNNWDSMTYHMARVSNWISNSNVSFYPTSISRQNYQMPLAEFAIMQLQILSGSDLFANLVQWVCFVVSIALGALIAEELSLDKRGQLISSVIIATIPMAILQSSSTQNDLVVSCFMLAFALFMLRLRISFTLTNLLYASLSFGLALLSKGTALVYCPAIGASLAVPILIHVWSNQGLLVRRIGFLSLVVLVAIVLNSVHYVRNYRLYGTLMPSGEEHFLNSDLSVSALLSNIPKNIALHLGTSSSQINWYTHRVLQLALGSQLNNPDNSLRGTLFSIIPYSRHEDLAGNPIHILALLFAFMSVFVWARKQENHITCYAVGVFLAGLLYCVCIRWQPWASRLHTPLFILCSPVIAIALSRHSNSVGRYIVLVLMVFMAFFSFSFALNNQSRSLLGQEWKAKDRMELYFANRHNLYKSYKDVMSVVAKTGASEVGLHLGEDDWEYPFWVFGKVHNIRFHHVGVNNQLKILHTDVRLPEYVIATTAIDNWCERKEYSLVYADRYVSLMKKIGPTPP